MKLPCQSMLFACGLLALSCTATAYTPTIPVHGASGAGAAAVSTGSTGSCPATPAAFVPILDAMNHATTWGHPDLWGEFAGMQRYFECDYTGAMKYFKFAARHADKLSQFTIGLMYLNGEGVESDPVAACAWLTLASERGFANYVSVRNSVCGMLTTAQTRQAGATYDTLATEYGDKVAKPRMKLALRSSRSEYTGSHIGFDFGNRALQGQVGSPETYRSYAVNSGGCGGPTISYGGALVPRDHCASSDFWSPWFWEPETYFAVRDAMQGKVSVGPLQQVENAATSGTRNN